MVGRTPQQVEPAPPQVRHHLMHLLLTILLVAGSGCAALTNPVANGVPVRRLPPELLGGSREALQPIALNLLRQPPPAVYRLDARDVLGIYIEGVLGAKDQPIPIRVVGQSDLPPALGYPVVVREDGTLSLPLIEPLRVQGMTVEEAEDAVRKAYTETKEILKPGRERIIVTLMQPRTYSVLVVREDGGTGAGNTPVNFGSFTGSAEIVGTRHRGTGFTLELPAYENDLLNALTRSGGLPGLDAQNEVLVYRGSQTPGRKPRSLPGQPGEPANPEALLTDSAAKGVPIVRVPLRLPPGEAAPFKPDEILLYTGDIVYVPIRKTEVFYTGGLLVSGQYPLPRDYDLDVVSAIAVVRGSLINGGQNSNNFTGTTGSSGIGLPNPSLVSIVRRTPGGGQFTIRVDLNRALQDPRERILIQPNDLIIVQNTIGEAVAQYFNSIFQLDFLGTIIRHKDALATTTITAP